MKVLLQLLTTAVAARHALAMLTTEAPAMPLSCSAENPKLVQWVQHKLANAAQVRKLRLALMC